MTISTHIYFSFIVFWMCRLWVSVLLYQPVHNVAIKLRALVFWCKSKRRCVVEFNFDMMCDGVCVCVIRICVWRNCGAILHLRKLKIFPKNGISAGTLTFAFSTGDFLLAYYIHAFFLSYPCLSLYLFACLSIASISNHDFEYVLNIKSNHKNGLQFMIPI